MRYILFSFPIILPLFKNTIQCLSVWIFIWLVIGCRTRTELTDSAEVSTDLYEGKLFGMWSRIDNNILFAPIRSRKCPNERYEGVTRNVMVCMRSADEIVAAMTLPSVFSPQSFVIVNGAHIERIHPRLKPMRQKVTKRIPHSTHHMFKDYNFWCSCCVCVRGSRWVLTSSVHVYWKCSAAHQFLAMRIRRLDGWFYLQKSA